ncbi:regulator of protease activity HflC (stomatin/prohibitin superfamily) [Nocardiopsis mwathae]|uniref:Regulator of protease activity HflC (Stomatin/prohibitin superfamily) n=1 Tax=Nocardiopsis mwathae TaxID=1472723 RepID=A0A7X0D5W0_9ACTN|nr:SPFH domain-containing protein [Nocardiopsis mwathae]MBB6171499.1 regulator of protease activity HflC (stomatin/prohibitin superfamily) [Nocardiopsis mwathae]
MTADTTTSAPGGPMPEPQYREHAAFGFPGVPAFLLCLLVLAVGAALVAAGFAAGVVALIPAGAVLVLAAVGAALGLTVVAPNEARVLQFLGRYVGTVRSDGLRWVNPLTTRRPVSTRIRNHETSVMKVNDSDGSPIEIAAVVVWQVEDTARAVFEVDDFVRFVSIQTEAAVRHIANNYPYDAHQADTLSLRDNADEITEKLSKEISERVQSAGVRIIESRFTHLAYAQEIAQAMLQRQQATAVVAARQHIVEGAVGMVDLALQRLSEERVVELDEERKASMVSNLLVVLCSDRPTNPVVNTGSLYQ